MSLVDERHPMIDCAIYTRKSTEERLDSRYNSLEAQTDACRAYIASQQHAGWSCVEDVFEDPGYSGGSLERPALLRLLEKVRAGDIGVVVVHKVDRLTRSLSDFAKLAELFEKHNVSFVSVTQHLDTSTSMGRLSLNVLLSFAQFEREIASERIKEKIHASRRRGLWTGGRVPLGYKCIDKKLIIDDQKAPLVRHFYSRYLHLGSVTDLRLEWKSSMSYGKALLPDEGRSSITDLSRGALCAILGNPIYAGKMRCGEQLVDGIHQGIISQTTWDAVQSKLSENRVTRRSTSDVPKKAMLLGKLVDEHGTRLTRSHTRKANGARYTYYVSSDSTRNERKSAQLRIPCTLLEQLVADRIVRAIADPQQQFEWAEKAGVSSHMIAQLAGWKPQVNDQTSFAALVLESVEKVELRDGKAKIALNVTSLLRCILDRTVSEGEIKTVRAIITAEAPILSPRQHGIKRITLHKRRTEDEMRSDGRKWLTLLVTGKVKTMQEIATMFGISQPTVSKTIYMALGL